MSPSPIEAAQIDLFTQSPERDAGLDAGLWARRQSRHDHDRSAGLALDDAAIAPLILALARLAAQRDARRIVQALQP